MLVAVRPPEYEDEEDKHPKWLYWVLIVYHLVFGAATYIEAFIMPKNFRFWPAIGILVTVILLTRVCHFWLFLPGEDRENLTP